MKNATTYMLIAAVIAIAGHAQAQSGSGTLASAQALPVALPNAAKSSIKADPAAWNLLKAAHDTRETFSSDFGGLTATILFNDNGTVHTGAVSYTANDDVTVDLDRLDPDTKEWLDDQAGSIFDHRRGGEFSRHDGQYPITFAVADQSPLGKLVELHDGLNSTYRVRNNQVVEVTRTMGGQRFTITVLESTETVDGKYLPKQFIVTYFDAKTGQLQKAAAYTDSYADVDGFWLPTSRQIVTAEDGKTTTRLLVFSDYHVKHVRAAK